MSHSLQTIHMLGKKPNKVYDPHLKTGLGYENPERLNKAIEAQHKMYDGEKPENNKLKVDLPDDVIGNSAEQRKKTYTYGDVRAKNQDLLMTISELKAKLILAKKGKNVNTKFDKSKTLKKLICVTPMNKNKDLKAKIVSKVKVKTDKSKPVTSCSTPKNEQVASSSSVRRLESKDINSKKRVLQSTKSKSTSKDVKKSQSSVSLFSNKRDTMNSNVSKSNANVLKAKTVNAVNDGLNLVCVSCGKDVVMISHDKCVARYALSLNSRVKRALFTSLVAAKSSKLGATLVVAKSRFSVATPT
ncbi:hypothetical protein Tco_1270008 [Tanacetum coccineum]